jgi:hypothetical protein
MSFHKTDQTVLGGLRPSGPRRLVGALVLGILGFLLVTLALRNSGAGFGLTLVLLAAGVALLWLVWRLWEATSHALILTPEALVSTDGQVVARIADIASVDRGVFALKPAGGFSLALRQPGPRVWQPGLWWRAGRRIGIGGVTNRHQARHLADQIATLLAARGND